jgi:hypothetical protein
VFFPPNCLSSAGVVNSPGSGVAQAFNAGQGFSSDSSGSFALMSTDLASSDTYNGGFRYSSGGALRIVDATSALPAGATYNAGVAMSTSGQVCIYAAITPTSDVVYRNGVAFTNDGRLYVAMPWAIPTEYWDGSLNVTVTGSNVSDWAPVKGTHSFAPIATGPTVSGSVLAFDGTQYLKTATFTLDQPVTPFLAFRQTGWTAGKFPLDGFGVFTGSISQAGSTPDIKLNAGSDVLFSGTPAVGTDLIASFVLNGASTRTQINRLAATTGNAGAGNPSGWTLGAAGNNTAPSQITVYGFGYAASALTQAEVDQVVAAMGRRYGISV